MTDPKIIVEIDTYGTNLTIVTNEGDYQQAVTTIAEIMDPEYRAAAVEAIVSQRLKREWLHTDSAEGMAVRREAIALVALNQ